MKRRILLLCSAVAVIMAIVAISFKSQNKKDFLYEDKQKQEIAPDQNDTLLIINKIANKMVIEFLNYSRILPSLPPVAQANQPQESALMSVQQ